MWGLYRGLIRGLHRDKIAPGLTRWTPRAARNMTSDSQNPQTPPSYQIPTIRALPFKKQYRKLEEVPQDTYPNPLFRMSKDEIHALKKLEYQNLATIPYKSIEETDHFCLQVVQLFHEIILSDTARASVLIRSIRDVELSERIIRALESLYKDDNIKGSVLKYMTTSSSYNFQPQCVTVLDYILQQCEAENASEVMLKYLESLASVNKVNDVPILLSAHNYDRYFLIVPREEYRRFYSCLVQLNMRPYSPGKLHSLKTALATGSNLDRFVYKSGVKDAKWHHTQLMVFDEMHQRKMANFFSLKELKGFALNAIDHELVSEANLYLGLQVQKFESLCSHQENQETSAEITVALQDVLFVILNHIMVFKGSENCTKILKYLLRNSLDITFDTFLAVMINLRKQGYYNEALTMVKNIPLQRKSEQEKQKIVAEIILLISLKFPELPKILVGYMAAFYRDGLEILERLGLLSHVYPYGEAGEWKSLVQVANVDPLLKEMPFDIGSFVQIYDSVLKTYLLQNGSQNIHSVIRRLFECYLEMVPVIPELTRNDNIVAILIRYLLKSNPSSPNMEIHESQNNMILARKIFERYHQYIEENLVMSRHSVYSYDLLIYASLMVHKDYAFAATVIRKSRSLKLPFTFNQIYPFIMFHYGRNEYKQAEIWYRELVSNGVKATAYPVKNIFKIARKLQWDVNGFVYRKYRIMQNRQDRMAQMNLMQDNVMFKDKDDVEESVTNELVGLVDDEESGDLSDELLNIMREYEQREAEKT